MSICDSRDEPGITLPYQRLIEDGCSRGGKHQVMIGFCAGDPAPAWCVKCDARAEDQKMCLLKSTRTYN